MRSFGNGNIDDRRVSAYPRGVSAKDDELDLERAEFDGNQRTTNKGSATTADAETGTSDSSPASATTKIEPAEQTCAACGRRIIGRYFEVNTQCLCPRCTSFVKQQHEVGLPGAFLRAALYGVAGGVLGAALYYGVLLVADAEFGIIAIAVGILVGKGVRRGAGLHRHWLYPALGIGLTYLAITATYIPEVLRAMQASEGAGGEAAIPSNPLTVPVVLGAWLVAAFVPVLMLVEFQIWGPIILAIGLWEGWRYGKAPALEFRGPLGAGAGTDATPATATGHTAP
jgi:hypothetical protein